MNDTSDKILNLYEEMFINLSPEERARKGCSMHDFSKEIVLSQIATPGKSHADVMGELFIRFYGEDFKEQSLEKILKVIRHYFEAPTA